MLSRCCGEDKVLPGSGLKVSGVVAGWVASSGRFRGAPWMAGSRRIGSFWILLLTLQILTGLGIPETASSLFKHFNNLFARELRMNVILNGGRIGFQKVLEVG